MFKKDVFERAGMRPGDIAHILNLSRIAVSRWYNAHTQPHRLIQDKLDDLTRKVEDLLSAGRLPLRGVTRSEIKAKLKSMTE